MICGLCPKINKLSEAPAGVMLVYLSLTILAPVVEPPFFYLFSLFIE